MTNSVKELISRDFDLEIVIDFDIWGVIELQSGGAFRGDLQDLREPRISTE